MCHCPFILTKKTEIKWFQLSAHKHRLLILGSLHCAHSNKTSKSWVTMFWGTLPPLYLLSLKPAFRHLLLKKLATKLCLYPMTLLDKADWPRLDTWSKSYQSNGWSGTNQNQTSNFELREPEFIVSWWWWFPLKSHTESSSDKPIGGQAAVMSEQADLQLEVQSWV